MAQRGFSARGVIIDFEMLKIKEQLASTAAPMTVSARRSFIEEKAGLSKREANVNLASALLQGAVDIDAQSIDVDVQDIAIPE